MRSSKPRSPSGLSVRRSRRMLSFERSLCRRAESKSVRLCVDLVAVFYVSAGALRLLFRFVFFFFFARPSPPRARAPCGRGATTCHPIPRRSESPLLRPFPSTSRGSQRRFRARHRRNALPKTRVRRNALPKTRVRRNALPKTQNADARL
ncbi:MAG: hypothetical protein BJ554DRAFT_494, partial [Olpidium bornovanus]